jgi:multiple sugar transport system permease protein
MTAALGAPRRSVAGVAAQPGSGRRRRRTAGSWWPYFTPALLVVLAINGAPIVYAAVLSFRDYNLARPGQDRWVGLRNYVQLAMDPAVQRSLLTTLFFVVVSVGASLVLGMALALLVNEIDTGKRIFRTLFFLPMLLAPAVIGVMWRFLLNDQAGPIGWLLKQVVPGISPLSDPSLALWSVTMVDVWTWTPFVFMILLAGLESVPQEPLEAAEVDGANAFQKFIHVVLPSLLPLISIAVLFRVTWSFRAFDHIYTMTQGGPGNVTEVLALTVYRNAFQNLDASLASALSIVMFLVMVGFAFVVLRAQSRRERR